MAVTDTQPQDLDSAERTVDVLVIGAGIVGLATAWRLQMRYTDLRIGVVDAADHVAAHQSGHNSGVLHSGIYYKPGSLKARMCRDGKLAMEAFCSEHGVRWEKCGKVVVATTANEVDRLANIEERARQNGVTAHRIDTDELREIEPHAAGLAGLHVPETGIVNYAKVCERLRGLVADTGSVTLNFAVARIQPRGSGLVVQSRDGRTISAGRMINCAGLQSDRVCRMAGGETEARIVPFRGEYYELAESSEHLCRHLIYPVPDPSFPFLGVHFTRVSDGGVECGPNAVLALAREGYSWLNVSPRDLVDTLSFTGFRQLAKKHWRMGLGEMHRSLSKGAFVSALRKLIPKLQSADLKPGRAGVRAQAIAPDGSLVDDFWLAHSPHAIHVLNAPSPAATASLAIAEHIVGEFSRSG